MRIRYRVRVNRAGIIFIGITIFLGVAAVNTANNLLYLVVSYMLSFMLLSGVASLYNIRGIEVLLVPPDEVFAGSETGFRLIIRNRKKLPSFLIEVAKDQSRYVVPLLKDTIEGTLNLVFERRGYCSTVTVEVLSSFPIGLFERYFQLEVPLGIVVFPKPATGAEYKGMSTEKVDQSRELSSLRKAGYDELYGIREYYNDPIKLIHWKLSAKTGKFYVKEMLEEASPPVVLSLDDVSGSVEERISKLTYLVIRFISNGFAVGLNLPGKQIEPSTGTAHKRRLLTELALLQ